MTELVRRYSTALTEIDLVRALDGSGPRVESIDTTIELGPLENAISGVLERNVAGSRIDSELVEAIHSALASMTRREAADMRVWHWLCVDQFPQLVLERWRLQMPTKLADVDASTYSHFLGKSTLVGVARNTLARLWWTAEQLGNYDSARKILSNQEDFVAILERKYGLYTPAALTALDRFGSPELSDGRQRQAAKWLQQNLRTTVVEALSEDEIGAILDESIQQA